MRKVTEGGRKFRRGAWLWTVTVSTFKSETYRFVRLPGPLGRIRDCILAGRQSVARFSSLSVSIVIEQGPPAMRSTSRARRRGGPGRNEPHRRAGCVGRFLLPQARRRAPRASAQSLHKHPPPGGTAVPAHCGLARSPASRRAGSWQGFPPPRGCQRRPHVNAVRGRLPDAEAAQRARHRSESASRSRFP